MLQGPSAHVSPAWYRARFPKPESDRSRTAPTRDYLTLTLRGRLRILTDDELVRHLGDLVARHEGAEGWRMSEIDPGFFAGLRGHILGYRLGIESFDCVAKFSQEQAGTDAATVAGRLCARGLGQHPEVADPVEGPTPITG